jgi:elongation factor P hydroxylase
VLHRAVLCVQDASDFPTDVDFKWAQDSYNVTQRNIDTWLFFGTFRARLWLLDQKWSYPGGFTGQQQSHTKGAGVQGQRMGWVHCRSSQ